MKKTLISLGIGSLLSRFFVYSLSLFIMGMIPNIFSVSDELWNNLEFYITQIGCLLLSFLTIVVFMFIGVKEKYEKKLFLFSSVAGVTLGGGVNHVLGTINSMLMAAAQRPDLEYIGMRIIMVTECISAAVFAILIFKAFYKNKETKSIKSNKSLLPLCTGTLLARFSAYTFFLLIFSNMPHIHAIVSKWDEIWSHIDFYVVELGCLLLSLLIIVAFTFLSVKDKCERKLFAFSSLSGVAFGGAVFNRANDVLSIYTASTGFAVARVISFWGIAMLECIVAVAVALLVFKTFNKEKKN